MKIFAPAKVNLMLHITGRRPDGYHTLQSFAAFADVGDVLDMTPAQEFSLNVSGPFAAHAPVGPDNLIVRAVRAMEDAAVRRFDAAVSLRKNIPAGAGLGGGSSDAAAMIVAINDIWDEVFDVDDLRRIAQGLGADVPVCVNPAARWMEGIGEIVTDATLQKPLHAVLIWPGQGLATPQMYSAYSVSGKAFTPAVKKPEVVTASFLQATHNDFTPVALEQRPDLKPILHDLALDEACLFARMSGSGSACFGVYDNAADAKKAAIRMEAAYPAAWVSPCLLH